MESASVRPTQPPGVDAVVQAYKQGVDRTLLRENLKLSVEERLNKLFAMQQFAAELRRAGKSLRNEECTTSANCCIACPRRTWSLFLSAAWRPRSMAARD